MQVKRKMSGGKSAHSFYSAPGIYHLHIAKRNGRWTAQNAKISERGKSGRKSGKKEPRIQRPRKKGLNAGVGLLCFFPGE